jgi:hypothetical protein
MCRNEIKFVEESKDTTEETKTLYKNLETDYNSYGRYTQTT